MKVRITILADIVNKCLNGRVLSCVLLSCRWCEHDPLLIWGSVQRCIEAALEAAQQAAIAAGSAKVNVVALGITNQRETTLVCPAHRAAAAQCNCLA